MTDVAADSAAAPGAPRVITFGCRLNAWESEVIRATVPDTAPGGTIVINTCAVTAEAERQARQAIRRARRQNPDATIVVTGCAAQIKPEAFAAMEAVDRVVGNADKFSTRALMAPDGADGSGANRVRPFDGAAATVAAPLSSAESPRPFAARARAFVGVQTGCDHRCTFCVIPYGRGPSRSMPAGDVVGQVRALADAGCREVALTGVDLTAWGLDLPGRPRLGDLVRRILRAVPSLPRLRLSSIDCVEMDDALLRALAEEERLMPHLHLSLQAGDDLILKRMRRRHSRDDAVRLCARIRALRPDVAFGADFIAGFPTETEAMFQRTVDMVADCGLTWLHVFPYSDRPGVPAARIPRQVPPAVRRARAARLRAAGADAAAAFLRGQVGRDVTVLVERPGGAGHTAQFAPVVLSGADGLSPGALTRARVTGVADGVLTGQVTRILAPAARAA